MTNTRTLLQYIAAIYLVLVVFISPGIPLLIKFFFGILPYLHSWLLINRLIFFLSLWLLGVGIYLLLANQKQKKSVLFTLHFGFRDWVLALLGALLAIYTSASLFATSIGSLVKLFPTEPYSAQMTVISAAIQGSRHKSVNLDLKSNADGKVYYLILSKRLFNYPKFNVGDKLILKGNQNWFGVYIEEVNPINGVSSDHD